MFTPEERKEVQLFLALLFPWDDENATLFKSVTWSFVGQDGDLNHANYAAQSMDDVIRLIEKRRRYAAANMYVALGTQRVANIEKLSADGFPKAVRKHANIVSFKSIYLDIDVKAGGYATTEDAFAALDDFCTKVGMPKPTMEVYSGSGGLHVYWCTMEPMPKANWLILARALQAAAKQYGMNFDPQVTVNPAGILRVPNTFNHKAQPAKRVFLYRDPGHTFPRYNYQQLAGALANYTDAPQGTGTHANTDRTKNFTENAGTAPPVAIDDIAVNCMAIDDILARGGDGDAEPLWNLALYAAAFTSDPEDAAHRLGNGDPRYTKDGTDKKLTEKLQARASNPEAGWPTCESFSMLSPKCAVCPLFVHKKSPFHHARRAQVTPSNVLSFASSGGSGNVMMPANQDPLMPENYWRNKDCHVFTTGYDKQGTPFVIQVINYPIYDAGLDEDFSTILMKVKISGVDQWRSINVGRNMQPAATGGALTVAGLAVDPRSHAAARDFLVSWTRHLQGMKRAAASSSYGWLPDGSFAFDDKIYSSVGSETVFKGKRFDENFKETGELKAWQDGMKLVYGNAALEALTATAFAAPLVSLAGSYSVVVSAYSAESGNGKSTALALAQAVWGHPRQGMSTLNDTNNSMMKKISDLRSLPVYWDELRTRDQLDKVIDIIFQVTQGKGKSRLNRDSVQMAASSFTTMFTVASNQGLTDTVYSQTESTQAGGIRLFEFEVGNLTKTMQMYDAEQLKIALESNYGCAGAVYAAWLARNRKVAAATVEKISIAMEAKHKFSSKERFWQLTMTTLIAGAVLSNHVGLTRYDLPVLTKFIDESLMRLRGVLKSMSYATMATSADVASLLQEMISEMRGKNLILTDYIPSPVKGKPTVANLVDTNLPQLQDIWLQVGVKDGRIRMRVRPFNDYIRKRRLNPRQIIGELSKHYAIQQGKQTIGAGVPGLDALAALGRAECYDLMPFTHAPSHGSDAPTQ